MSTTDVICTSCGSINDFRTEDKNGQRCAYCNGCDAYIKNIAYRPPIFYFGKYKGMLIAECQDMGYLQWFLDKTAPKGNIKRAVEDRISTIQFEGK